MITTTTLARARTFTMAALATGLLAGAAGATTNLHALLEGSPEVPPVSTPGTGDATFVLNDATFALDFEVNYVDLLGPTTAVHLHRGVAGQNGPVVYTLSAGNFPSGYQGTVQIDSGDVPQLLNQGFYCNILTQQYPGGEVRGQVVVTGTPVGPVSWGRIKELYKLYK